MYCFRQDGGSSSHSTSLTASGSSPDNYHNSSLDSVGNGHKMYRSGGPNGTSACPPPTVLEPYSPPKVIVQGITRAVN